SSWFFRGMFSHLLGMSPGMSWKLYLPILAGAFLLSLPFVILAEARGWFRANLLGAICGLGFAVTLMLLDRSSGTGLVIALALYFSAFTLLEALLPSWVSRIAPVGFSGTAMGVYSSGQFLGIFFGGAVGGLILARWGETGILAFDFLLVGLWFVIAFPIRKVNRTLTLIVPVSDRGGGWGRFPGPDGRV
ncbi:major facilitator family transporter, partial [mine drainage metagenome]